MKNNKRENNAITEVVGNLLFITRLLDNRLDDYSICVNQIK